MLCTISAYQAAGSHAFNPGYMMGVLCSTALHSRWFSLLAERNANETDQEAITNTYRTRLIFCPFYDVIGQWLGQVHDTIH